MHKRRVHLGTWRKAVAAMGLAILETSCGSRFDDAERAGAEEEARRDLLNPAVWIEGGTFVAGSDDWREEYPVGSPFSKEDEDTSRWTLDGFWIQEHEVTNEEYALLNPEHVYPAGQERRPVVHVTWAEAMAYARSLGGTLPSEVHWEYAARGPVRREYPWGNSEPSCELAHYSDCDPRSTVEVKTRAGDVTPEGVYDLAGNVREWVTAVWFDRDRHPVNNEVRSMKGGSFMQPAFFLRSASVRNDVPSYEEGEHLGFRVAWRTRAPTR